jgi:hypothetical protein
MFVWLDDQAVRDPEGTWAIVRTADEAISLLMTGQVEMISLDHDLGDVRHDPYPREVTGMAVVEWMWENEVFPKIINVHSWNPSAACRMITYLRGSAPPETTILQWRADDETAWRLEMELSDRE